MAYKTESLAKTLDQIDETMIRLKQFASAVNGQMAATSIDSDFIINIRARLNRDKTTLQALSGTPGLVQYAKDQKNDQAYDITTEFTAVIAAITAVASDIESTFPKDANGYLLERTFSGTSIAIRQFTPAQTAGLRGFVTTLVGTIE